MDIIQMEKYQEFLDSKVTKKVPLLTDQHILSILSFGNHSHTKLNVNAQSDEIIYVIDGTGQIKKGDGSHDIRKGTLIVLSSGDSVDVQTNNDQLSLMLIKRNPIPDSQLEKTS